MANNIDLAYVLLKMCLTKVKKITSQDALVKVCEFFAFEVINRVISQDRQPQPNHNCKLLEVSLKVLYKAWKLAQKLCTDQKALNSDFTQKVFNSMVRIEQLFPKNDIFRA